MYIDLPRARGRRRGGMGLGVAHQREGSTYLLVCLCWPLQVEACWISIIFPPTIPHSLWPNAVSFWSCAS